MEYSRPAFELPTPYRHAKSRCTILLVHGPALVLVVGWKTGKLPLPFDYLSSLAHHLHLHLHLHRLFLFLFSLSFKFKSSVCFAPSCPPSFLPSPAILTLSSTSGEDKGPYPISTFATSDLFLFQVQVQLFPHSKHSFVCSLVLELLEAKKRSLTSIAFGYDQFTIIGLTYLAIV